MEDLSKSLKKIKIQKRNPHLHSDVHMLVDEVRNRFGETATKGKGSFAFYLGFFNRIGADRVRRILGEMEESGARDEKKLFWWKVKNG